MGERLDREAGAGAGTLRSQTLKCDLLNQSQLIGIIGDPGRVRTLDMRCNILILLDFFICPPAAIVSQSIRDHPVNS